MKQTAVEWLEQQMRSKATFIATPKNENEYVIETSVFREIINQAKAMEKEQIINAASWTPEDGLSVLSELAEQYYNETFKSE